MFGDTLSVIACYCQNLLIALKRFLIYIFQEKCQNSLSRNKFIRFVTERKKRNNSDVKTQSPLDIIWSTPYWKGQHGHYNEGICVHVKQHLGKFVKRLLTKTKIAVNLIFTGKNYGITILESE